MAQGNLYPDLSDMAQPLDGSGSNSSDIGDEIVNDVDEGSVSYLPVTQAIKLIPKVFSGNKSELREFISSVETAIDIVAPSQRQLFVKFIESKITGDAKIKLLSRSGRDDWGQIKAIVEENYATRRTIDFFACKLFNSKQGGSEGVASWGSRIDAMSSELTEAMVRLLPTRHHEGAIAFLKYISKACFIQGLQDERVQTVVRARDEKMLLPNAVEIALEEESAILSGRFKKQSLPQVRNLSSNPRPQVSQVNSNAYKGLYKGYQGNFKRNRNVPQVNVICFNCQKEGHMAKECRGAPKCDKCSRLGHRTRDCRVGQSSGNRS